MPESTEKRRADWLTFALWVGLSILTVVLWSLATIGALYLLGWVPC